MRNVNWDDVTTSNIGDTGGFPRLEPGGYVAKIVSAADHEDRSYFELVFDIAEGPNTGHYSDAWGVEHPNAHRIVMSYKPTAVNMLAGRLNAIDASNPGFDSRAACKANRFDFFVGRLVGVVMREEEYRRRDGSVGVRVSLDQVVTVQAVRDGLVKPRAIKRLADGGSSGGGEPFNPVIAASIDVPFA